MSTPLPVSQDFLDAVQHLTEERPPQAASAIYSTNGIKLIDKGNLVDHRLYERLTRHQLAAPLQDSLLAQDSVNGKFLRFTAETLIAKRPVLACMLSNTGVQAQLLEALESVPLPPPIAFQLTVARDVHPALFQYAVCSALVAGWLATGAGALRYDIVMLVSAGLLQDLGMLHIDPVLLQSEGELTREQRRQMYSHPLVSALLLERHHEYPRELIRAVREHHELLDGTGYPANLSGDKISPWGRMLSLAQVVSAMLRPSRGLPALRLSLLLRTNRHQFDLDLGDRVLAVLQQLGREGVPASPTEMAALEPVSSPVDRLMVMDRLLADWPAQLGDAPGTTPARRLGMATIAQQCEQMRRLLAEVGASAEQLKLLGEDFEDAALLSELSLVTQEMAWQLRTLTRHASRRWAAPVGEALPPALRDWMNRVKSCIGDIVET